MEHGNYPFYRKGVVPVPFQPCFAKGNKFRFFPFCYLVPLPCLWISLWISHVQLADFLISMALAWASSITVQPCSKASMISATSRSAMGFPLALGLM